MPSRAAPARGLPRLHGLEDVLRPSAAQNGHSAASTGNGRAWAAAPVGPMTTSTVPFGTVIGAAMAGMSRPLAGVVAAPVFGAQAPSAGGMVDAWYGSLIYVPAPLAAQEWPFHALLESLRQQYGGA